MLLLFTFNLIFPFWNEFQSSHSQLFLIIEVLKVMWKTLKMGEVLESLTLNVYSKLIECLY